MNSRTLRKLSSDRGAFYLNESSMVQDLSAVVTRISGPVHCREVTREFDYASGRADLVGLGHKDRLHVFEAKLYKWRVALEQARRNACFAHYCYVALPEQAASSAVKARAEFQRHGVGLLIIRGQEARLAIRPRRNVPWLTWLTRTALARLSPKLETGKHCHPVNL